MATQIVNLRGVPEDEADEIRALLELHEFDYYETPGGAWGMSMPGFWLKDDIDVERAKTILLEYQQERRDRIANEYQDLKRKGLQPTIWRTFIAAPSRYLLLIVLIAFVLYLSINPFVSIGK